MDPEDVDVAGQTGWKSAAPVRFALDEAKEGDVLVAFAKTGVVDKDRHLTEPGAFPSKEVPISDYGHSSWPQKGARLPVGRTEIGEEGDLALARGRFFVDTTHGRDTYLTVRHLKDLQEWSYGYQILEGSPGKDQDGKRIVRLKRLDVFEVSPTLRGAGVATRVVGIKSDEDGPLAGLPFAEDFDRVLIDVDAIVARSKSLREIRAKDGRELSEANRQRITRLRDGIAALEDLRAEVDELLARTDRSALTEDPDAKALGASLFLAYQQIVTDLEAGPRLSIG